MDTRNPDQLPWWAQTRARIALLLLILVAGGGVAALASATRSSAGGGKDCWIREGAPTIGLSPTVITAAVRRLGLTALPPAGAATVRGLSTPDAAWNGRAPRPIPPHATFVGAGYAITWRTAAGDQLGVAAYRFPSTAEAGSFTARASSTHCRPGTAAEAASAPAGGRLLTQRAPGTPTELDLFFARGFTGYWLFEVPARAGVPIAATRSTLTGLACRLTEARCAGRHI